MSSVNHDSTFVGLDLGTSGLRAVVLSATGQVLASCSSDTSACSYPHPTWSEQHPDLWLQCLRQVFAILQQSHPNLLSRVSGIGVSGHMHGLVALDETHTPVIPCILWNDTRSHVEACELDADPAVRTASGNCVFPGMTAPKVAWLQKHMPDALARVRHIMLPKDYVNLYLTGVLSTERSDLAGTCYLDVRTNGMNTELLQNTTGGLCDSAQGNLLPPIHYGCDNVGTVRPKVAAELHLPSSARVVAGAADNAAAACGLGMTLDGDAFVSLGTSGIFFLCTGRKCCPSPEAGVHAFAHAVPDTFYDMGVTLCAADSLAWLAELCGSTPGKLVDSLSSSAATGPGRVMFLPYLSGERTPYNEPEPKGAFLGMSRDTTASDLARAVIEGVAFSIKDCMEVVADAQRNNSRQVDVPAIFITGGGARSNFWADTVAQVLQTTVHRPQQGELGAAVGAARLALVGAGNNPVNDVMKKPDVERTFHPKPELGVLYSEVYQRYRKSYGMVKNLA